MFRIQGHLDVLYDGNKMPIQIMKDYIEDHTHLSGAFAIFARPGSLDIANCLAVYDWIQAYATLFPIQMALLYKICSS